MAAVKHRLDPTRLKLVYKGVHKNGAGQAVYVMEGEAILLLPSKQKDWLILNLVIDE